MRIDPGGDEPYRAKPSTAAIVSWNDPVMSRSAEIEGMSPADLPVVTEVIRSAGHLTVRLYFEDEGEAAERERIEEVNRRGATYENANDTMYALDLEPHVSPKALLDYLAVEEEAGHVA